MTATGSLTTHLQLLRSRLRQQSLVASFGTEALRAGDFDALLDAAARSAAEGLGTELAKVLEYLPGQDALLIRAGVGWQEGVVGVVKLGADTASPAGFALKTARPVISNHLAAEARFRTPAVMAEHGVRRAVNVIIRGEGDGPPFGVLEADSRQPDEEFSDDDIAFLQALANTIGLAADRERDRLNRDLLMREVHHRVKNGLQIAQTVLRLQARSADSEAVRRQLDEAAQRILTIAAVHEHLYGGQVIGRVAVAGYLRMLIRDIGASTGAAQSGRLIRLEIPEAGEYADWDADRATTLGLVVTELVTNALKYGRGAVSVLFEPDDGIGGATIAVEDGGDGPDGDFDPTSSTGLGMRLLNALLRGGLKLDRSTGRARFVARLP
jgi:two-component sensor histidine kinase